MKDKFDQTFCVDAIGLKEIVDFCNNEENQNSGGSWIFYIERAQTILSSVTRNLPPAEEGLDYGVRLLANIDPTEEQREYLLILRWHLRGLKRRRKS